jgi:ssDNA-binding Zn-finger/Zn-ribbon topoisomerase 1
MSEGIKEAQKYLLSGLITSHLMNKLQERAVECGVCPRCHAKTLRLRHETLGMEFEQCEKCLTVYVLPCGVA